MSLVAIVYDTKLKELIFIQIRDTLSLCSYKHQGMTVSE